MRLGPRAFEAPRVIEADDAAEPVPAPRPGSGRGAGWIFGAITVVPALLAAAWLLPGLPLVLVSRFAALPMVLMSAPLAVVLCYFALRQLPTSWPSFRPERPAPESPAADRSSPEGPAPEAPEGLSPKPLSPASQASQRPEPPAPEPPAPEGLALGSPAPEPSSPAAQADGLVSPDRASRRPELQVAESQAPPRPVPWWAVAGTVAVAVVFAVWQIAERTEQILAHHGSLPIPDSVAAFGGSHPGLSFASVNYYPVGAGIVPQFMTGMPVVLAGVIWLAGVPGALVVTPLIGGCAVLSFGGLAGRLAGPRWAPAAAAVLAVSLPEQYTSRSTFSEPLAQVLLFGGLCLLADALVVTRARHGDAAARGWLAQDKVLAALGGLALGLSIVVRLDGLSDLLPAVPFAGVLLAARRRPAVPFAVALVIGVGYGLADGYLLSRPYLNLEAPSLRPLALITAVVVVLTAAAVAVSGSGQARAKLAGWRKKRVVRWLPAAAAALTVLIFAGFAVRPLVQTVAGETDPTSIAYVAELQKLAGLPIDGRQQYYQDSLYWVIWYLGLPAVLLGAFGLAVLARRGLHALVTWQDPAKALRVWALPGMVALWVVVTVLSRPAVSPDQPWASRRLVPFVLPGLILGAIWASVWLKDRAARRGGSRATAAVAASCCVASMIIPATLTNLDIGVSKTAGGVEVGVHGMAFRRIGAGELAAVDKLCAAIGPGSSVVILDQLTADRFAQLVRGMCGAPAAVLTTVTPATVSAVVTGVEQTGRHPVLLAENSAELASYGGTPRAVVNLLTTQEAHNLTSPPTRTWLIHYTVWMSEPGVTAPAGAAT
ncbi:MAG: hypothetical protein ABSA53_11125 [Streptosporangiaceae bacterium]